MEKLNILFRPGLSSWGCKINGKKYRAGSIHIKGDYIIVKALVSTLAEFKKSDIKEGSYNDGILTISSINGEEIQLKIKKNDVNALSKSLSLGLPVTEVKDCKKSRLLYFIIWPYGLYKLYINPKRSFTTKIAVTVLIISAYGILLLPQEKYADNGILSMAIKPKISIKSREVLSKELTAQEQEFIAGEVYKGALSLLNSGKHMEKYRKDARYKTCGQLMRSNLSKVDLLRKKSSNLNNVKYLFLGSAITQLQQCVTCHSSALSECEQASKYLKKSKSRHKF